MNLDESVKLMAHTDGYTLWVGAGVAIQLARAGGGNVAGWAQLCNGLEDLAHINGAGADYPQRLDACFNALGRFQFQNEVRNSILHSLCDTVISAARRHIDPDDCVPTEVKQLAALGALANPIVSFNVETLTSIAIAHSGGPYSFRTFTPPLDELEGLPRSSGGGTYDGKRFRRAIYHVHGALDAGGICVLTKSEYDSMKGTLALQLAAHAAFASRLFIVGMSLEDAYLRMQLEQFKPQLHGVFWFVDDAVRADLVEWAERSGVTPVHVGSWNDFWFAVQETLPAPSELDAALTWSSILSEAIHARSPQAHTWMLDGFRDLGGSELMMERWRRRAKLAGVSAKIVDQTEVIAFEEEMARLEHIVLRAIAKLA